MAVDISLEHQWFSARLWLAALYKVTPRMVFPTRGNLFVGFFLISNNGNRTEWSPVRSVIIRVINKIAVVRFVIKYITDNDLTTRCPVNN